MLMPIGRFAWCTGLSVKALRHYDELGLLPPARVDRETGYRWYSPEQVEIAIRVRRLRELDLPLAEIRGIRDGADERAILSAHRERVEARRARDTRILAELAGIVGGVERILPDDWLYRIEVKDIAPQDVAVIAGRVPAAELDRWVKDSIGELLEQLGEQGIGPPFAIRPAPDDQEMVEVEVGLPIAGPVEGRAPIAFRHEPACRALVALHQGRLERLPGLYRALATAIGEQGIEPAAEPRELYLSNPDDRHDPLVEVVWPIDVAPAWQPEAKLFTQALPG